MCQMAETSHAKLSQTISLSEQSEFGHEQVDQSCLLSSLANAFLTVAKTDIKSFAAISFLKVADVPSMPKNGPTTGTKLGHACMTS